MKIFSKKTLLIFLFILIISILMPCVWFKDGLIRGSGESGLPFYSLRQQFEATRYSWSPYMLGNPRGINIASIPTDFVFFLLEKAGIDNYLMQAMFLGLLFLLSGAGIYLLTRLYFPKLGHKYFLLSVIFYWFNPLSLVNVWNRFLYNFMVFWAFFPIAIFVFERGIKNRNYRYAPLLSILTAVFSYSLSGPSFIILLWATLFIILIYRLVFGKNIRKFLLFYFLLSVISFIGINFWWISQLLAFIFSGSYGVSVNNFFSSSGNLSNLELISYILGNFYNNYLFMHGTFFTTGPLWARYFTSTLIKTFSYSMVLIIMLTILRYYRKRNVLFLSLIFVLSIFLIKGLNPPFGDIFKLFFENISPLQVFRNPFEKFGFLLSVYSSLLFVYGLGTITVKNRLKKVLYLMYFLFIFIFWGYPYISSKVFSGLDLNGKSKFKSNVVTVPEYYQDVNNWFSKINKDFRFISLPLGGEGITYNWDQYYSGVELSSTLFSTPNISFNTTVPYYSQIADEIHKYQLNEKIIDFAPITNSWFFVARSDINYKADKLANPKSVENNLQKLVSLGFLSEVYERGEIKVYKINDSYTWPKIYVTDSAYVSNTIDIPKLSNYINEYPNRKIAIVNSSSILKTDFDKEIIVPDSVYLQNISKPLPKDISEEMILSRLFYVSHLPGSWHYPLIRIKENILDMSQKDFQGHLIYQNGLLGKRAVEVYLLRNDIAKKSIILKAEKDFQNRLEALKNSFLELKEEKSPLSELVADSLVYQWILFERSGSPLADSLADLLVNWGIKPKYELPISDYDYAIFSFDIKMPGKYMISLDPLKGIKEIYFDGVLTKNNIINISVGKHEIAYSTKDIVINSNVLSVEEFNITKDTQKKWNINIPDMPSKFFLKFQYRFVRGNTFDVKVSQDIDSTGQDIFTNRVIKENDYHGWRTFEKEFTTSSGASIAEVKMLPSELKKCHKVMLFFTRCKMQNPEYEVEIKNFSVFMNLVPEPDLVLNNNISNSSSTLITATKENPTLYEIKINKKSSNREILVFSELFNSGWKVYDSNGGEISEENHFLVNGYANAWYFDKIGESTLYLKYQPQQILNLAYKISLFSLTVSIAALVLIPIRKRKSYVN